MTSQQVVSENTEAQGLPEMMPTELFAVDETLDVGGTSSSAVAEQWPSPTLSPRRSAAPSPSPERSGQDDVVAVVSVAAAVDLPPRVIIPEGMRLLDGRGEEYPAWIYSSPGYYSSRCTVG